MNRKSSYLHSIDFAEDQVSDLQHLINKHVAESEELIEETLNMMHQAQNDEPYGRRSYTTLKCNLKSLLAQLGSLRLNSQDSIGDIQAHLRDVRAPLAATSPKNV